MWTGPILPRSGRESGAHTLFDQAVKRACHIVLLFLTSSQCLLAQSDIGTKDKWPTLNGKYAGQTLPGSKPMIFGEGHISIGANHEYGSTFSPDGNEFYFTRRSPDQPAMLYVIKNIGNVWAPPERVMDQMHEPNEAHISPDGQRLFFGTRTALHFSIKSGNQWAEPQTIGGGMYITATSGGTIYYTNTDKRPLSIVKRTLLPDGSYSDEKEVQIDSLDDRHASHPFIFPREEYMILNLEGDLFISFKRDVNIWSKPKRLNDQINTEVYEFAPYVSKDGKYFFFSRGDENRTDIYWVEASVLFK